MKDSKLIQRRFEAGFKVGFKEASRRTRKNQGGSRGHSTLSFVSHVQPPVSTQPGHGSERAGPGPRLVISYKSL